MNCSLNSWKAGCKGVFIGSVIGVIKGILGVSSIDHQYLRTPFRPAVMFTSW